MEPAFTQAERMAPYIVHVKVEWTTDAENKRARNYKPRKHDCKNLAEVENVFIGACNMVRNNRLHNVRKVEVKQGRRVLFMQRFENGVAL